MRISDWSSDVCSSDLGGLEDSEKNKRSISPHPWRFPPFGREEWPRRLPAIFGGPTTCIRGRSAREHLRAALEQAAYLALNRRSEEHTSELQSLMRISYAVFCLKKKKNKKKQHKLNI